MMTVDELLRRFDEMKLCGDVNGETPVLIDCGPHLAEIEDIDMDASDECTCIIWCGDKVEE